MLNFGLGSFSSEIPSLRLLFRRLDELHSQLVQERDKVADLDEQLQRVKSQSERQLTDTKEKHQSQTRDLQEKVVKLVGISGRCSCSVTGCVNNLGPTRQLYKRKKYS